MSFPSSAVGLPMALNYNLPPSLPDSARAFSVNVAPDGITSVTGPAISSIFTASGSGTATAFPNFTQQMISFTLPSGMSDSVFLDPASTTLSFTMSYTVSTAPSLGGSTSMFNLIGSGSSWFDQLVLYSNNVPIETVNQYGLLQNFLLANTVNSAERYGGISVAMGADTNGYNGIDLGTSASTFRYNFTIPLLSVIGANSDKFFPIGACNNMQLQMTTASLYPLASYTNGTVTTAGAIANGITLSEFTLNMKYIDVGDMAGALMKQTLQDGKWFIKSQTYTNSAVSIPSGSSGTQQLLLQIRNTSVKSILHQFGIAQGSSAPNGYYDAINPGLTARQCQVGGNFYPNKQINDSTRPSEGYPYLIQALTQGGGITKAYGTIVDRNSYNSIAGIASVPTGADTFCQLIANGARPVPTSSDNANTVVVRFPSMAYYGYDLEKSAGILFQGVNTRASPPFLNLFLSTATNATILCSAWGLSDVIIEVDTIAKQVKAYV